MRAPVRERTGMGKESCSMAQVIHFEISRRGLNVFREFKTILRLMEIYRKERPDIVHHIAMKPMLYGSLVSH